MPYPVRGALVERIGTLPDRFRLSWAPVELATYDVVTGDLALLGAGDSTAAIDGCETSRTAETSITLAERPAPRFYLVRAVVGATRGTWDDGPGLAASRDAAIDAAPAACP